MTRFSQHLIEDVLPWWEQHGVDDAAGGVRTGFANDGTLVTTDRFTWSQGRWAWVCGELADEAIAQRLDLDPGPWRERCLATVERMCREAVRSDGRTHFRLAEAGEPVALPGHDSASSVFADLFCVLGITAGLRTLSPGDRRSEQWATTARHILSRATAAIADGSALTEPYPVPPGFHDLAGPMTLLHVAAELQRTPGACELGNRVVRESMQVLEARHFASGAWREFACDQDAFRNALLTRHVTPGHLLELLWMAEHAEEALPSCRFLDRHARVSLAERAWAVGRDSENGGVFRYVDRDGGPPWGTSVPDAPYEALVRNTWDTKLWWVHIEALYTTALYAEDSPVLRRAHDELLSWIWDVFPEPGREWLQIRDRQGRPLNTVVALPVKDPFHIIRGLIFLNRIERRKDGR